MGGVLLAIGRQREGKNRALARLTTYLDLAAMRFHESATDRQSDPGPRNPPVSTSPIKGIEEMRHVSRRNTRAGIGNGDLDHACFLSGRNGVRCPGRRVLNCVFDEIR